MATYSLAPNVKRQYLDDSGNPLANGRIYTFLAGTTTPQETFQTSDGTTWGSFVQLDAAGRPDGSSEIYLLPGLSYKFTARNSSGVDQWTQDNIAAVPLQVPGVDIAYIAGQNITAGQAIYLSRGTGSLVAGRWYLTDADLAYASSVPLVAIAVTSATTGTAGTARITGTTTVNQVLSVGSDYYASGTAGALATTAGANVRYIGRATSASQLELAGNPRPEQTTYNLQTDFGAVLDGTTDDTSAMTAALAVVAAVGGGTIYIPAGTCLLASLTTVPTDHTHIMGAGQGITTVTCSSTTGAFLVQGDFCSITDITILFTGAAGYGVKFFNGSTDPTTGLSRPSLSNVKIKGSASTSHGLWLVNTTRGSFTNCYLPCGGGDAVRLEAAAFHTFVDLLISINFGEASPQWAHGITIQKQDTNVALQSDDNKFYNAVVEGVTGNGIYITSTFSSGPLAGTPPARNSFIGGTSEGNLNQVYIENGQNNSFYSFHVESGTKFFWIAGNDGNHTNAFYGCLGQLDIDNPSTAQGIQATTIVGHVGNVTISGSKVFGTQIYGVSGTLSDSGTSTVYFQSTLAASPNAVQVSKLVAATVESAGGASDTALATTAGNGSYTGTVITANTTRAANTAFNLLDLKANSVSQFKVGGTGIITYADGSFGARGIGTAYKIARGSTAFDGSNPTTVATGLTTIVAVTATLLRTTALSAGTAFVTHATASGASVDFYAWDITGAASTGTETFEWIAIGT